MNEPALPIDPASDDASAPIVCEIHARHAAHAAALAEIALTCGRDVALRVHPRRVIVGRDRHAREDVLVLRLPAHLASSQHRVWCLACRLACFLPDARISVEVSAVNAFRPPRARRRRTVA